jgi:uncharacterized protein (TIGR04255 family)
MPSNPTFVNPPIVELVLGAQFSPLTELSSGHLGWFWRELGSEWVKPVDAPLLDDQFELFDRPRLGLPHGVEIRLEPMSLPGRLMIHHQGDDRLLQIQATRFHLNWRKREEFYPSYWQLISEFEQIFDRFSQFAEDAGAGKMVVNQWELTYIDSFAQGDYWEAPANWSAFLPGLFGELASADGLVLDRRAAQWSYEIAPKRGRLHIAAQLGRTRGVEQPTLLLQMTARGPVGKGGAESLRAGLDLGHAVALETFLRITSQDAQERWKRK